MPGRRWYVVAALIFFVGLLTFGSFLLLRLKDLDEGFQQVVVPGSGDLRVEEPGRYTIYRETGASVGGVYYGGADLTGLEVVVQSPSGESVDLVSPAMNETYELGGRSGVAIFRFQAPAPGVYHLEASYPGGAAGPAGVLAVGQGFMKSLLITIFVALGIAMGSFTLALVIAIVTFVRRYRAKRRLAAPPVVPYPAQVG